MRPRCIDLILIFSLKFLLKPIFMLPLFPDSSLIRGEFDLAEGLLEVDAGQG